MLDLLLSNSPWLRSLGPDDQAAATACLFSFAVLAPLMIWQRIRLYRRGGQKRRGQRAVEFVCWLLFFAGVYYLSGRYAWLAEAVSWPDRHWQMWRQHRGYMFFGFIVAGYAAMALAALFAALFLRGSRPAAMPAALPAMPAGFAVFRKRTFHETWEDE